MSTPIKTKKHLTSSLEHFAHFHFATPKRPLDGCVLRATGMNLDELLRRLPLAECSRWSPGTRGEDEHLRKNSDVHGEAGKRRGSRADLEAHS